MLFGEIIGVECEMLRESTNKQEGVKNLFFNVTSRGRYI